MRITDLSTTTSVQLANGYYFFFLDIPGIGHYIPDASERRANVHNAFQCTSGELAGKSVILVDDVCTTGFTLESACTAMRESGTVSVWAFALARAKPGAGPDQDGLADHPRATP